MGNKKKRGAENKSNHSSHLVKIYQFFSYVQQHFPGFYHQNISFKIRLRVAGREGSHPCNKPHTGGGLQIVHSSTLGLFFVALLSVRTASLPTGCVRAEAASNSVSFCLGFYEVDICPLATGEEPPVSGPNIASLSAGINNFQLLLNELDSTQ